MKKSFLLKTTVALSAITLPFYSLAAETTNYAEAAFTTLGNDAKSYLGYAWPIVVTITVGLIGIKLFKKFANRAV
ncbi:major coat protein [Providencia alcalifaciens]